MILHIEITNISIVASTSVDCYYWSSPHFFVACCLHPPHAEVVINVAIAPSSSTDCSFPPLLLPLLLMIVTCHCHQSCCHCFFHSCWLLFSAVILLFADITVADCCRWGIPPIAVCCLFFLFGHILLLDFTTIVVTATVVISGSGCICCMSHCWLLNSALGAVVYVKVAIQSRIGSK